MLYVIIILIYVLTPGIFGQLKTYPVSLYYVPNRNPVHILLYLLYSLPKNYFLGNNITIRLMNRSMEQGPNILYASETASEVVAYGGVGTSKLTSGVAAVLGFLNRPVIGSAETSPSLSDKNQYPTFLRVIPPDQLQGQAIAAFVQTLGISKVNLLYTNDIYGEALGQIVGSNLKGVKMDSARAFSSDFSKDEINRIIQDLTLSKTKVNIMTVFVSANTSRYLLDALKDNNALTGYAWIFSEALFTSTILTSLGTDFQGLIATAPSANSTRYSSFANEFNNKNLDIHKAYLNQLGDNQIGTAWTTNSLADSYTVDAMQTIILGIKSTLANGNSPSDGVALYKNLKNLTFEGLTGTVSFDKNGDRIGSIIQIINTNANGWANVGTWTNFAGLQLTSPIIWPGGSNSPPKDAVEGSNTKDDKSNVVMLAVAVSLGALVFLLLASIAAYYCYKRQKLIRIAPRGRVCLVFTDIQSSTELWERVPEAMRDSLVMQEKLIRKLIAQYKGYEVKTIGDSFMISFHNCVNAINFCNDSQQALMYLDWPQDLLQQPVCAEVKGKDNKFIYRGIRVRMGVHVGQVDAQANTRSGTIDYYGTTVNVAARVESLAHGGQVIVSEPVKLDLEITPNHNTNLTYLGSCALKGLGNYEVFDARITELSERVFPPPNQQAAAAESTVLDKVRQVKNGYQLCSTCSRPLKCPQCSHKKGHNGNDSKSSHAPSVVSQ